MTGETVGEASVRPGNQTRPERDRDAEVDSGQAVAGIGARTLADIDHGGGEQNQVDEGRQGKQSRAKSRAAEGVAGNEPGHDQGPEAYLAGEDRGVDHKVLRA